MKLYDLDIKHIAIENPVGFINGTFPAHQTIEPFYFGDSNRKKTCLWLKNLPKLFYGKEKTLFNEKTIVKCDPIYIDKSGKKRYFTDAISGKSKEAQKLRSKTFPGIAKAISEQWGEHINRH
jgi:hypothetical protein